MVLLVVGVFLVFSLQAKSVNYGNTNTWGLLVNSFRFNSKWGLTNELHYRTGDFLNDKAKFIYRPSVVYHANKNIELSVGYSYLRHWSYEPYTRLMPSNEHNVWTQVLQKWRVGKVKFQNRFRQENRFIDTVNIVNGEPEIGGVKYANRFRYRLTATFDIVELKSADRSIFLNIFDEIWINQGDNFMPTDFARNWFYVGLGYKFSNDFNMQLATMNQYDARGNNNFISSTILQLTVFKGFNFNAD